MTDTYSTLRLSSADGIARIVLDNPPVNAITATMMRELWDVLTAVAEDPAVKVIVFSSANPEIFLAHVDMRIGAEMATLRHLAAAVPAGSNVFQFVNELLRHQPQVTIVELAGKARGGGAEFVAAADLSFAAAETAGIGHIEALMGITPGGGGTQYLRRRVGRHRALEAVLTGDIFDAATAASYGWVNRALPASELSAHVDRVARDIAALADGVVEQAKRAMAIDDLSDGLRRENEAWASLVNKPAAAQLAQRGLGNGAQTPEGERNLEALMRSAAQR